MYDNPYASPYSVAAQPVDIRSEFIKKTYMHLAGAIGLFALLEYVFLQIPAMRALATTMTTGFSWLIVIGLFMVASMVAQKWAHSGTSKGIQYAGLALLSTAYAVLFLPVMLFATAYAPEIITQAAIITAAMTLGVTFIAFTTKKDFSFLGGFLKIGGFVALGLIVASIFIGFNLGIIFCAFMVVFACVAILKDTSDVLHHYGSNQYVAASLSLFASIALLFWYVIQILMSLSSND
ncbi:hypothetical protein SAMN02745181_2283 [Rubritalea squalenifaciens DSM 18772]|uniref:Modulator of FtsH protease n=1 Tax=Rubritalea squalenifaciens DSM 18772 TaxID=1123071 RepID=A0A1M6L3N0_9BACT|nr:Bax inhibitor-1 family protein [Rubritalea squalenifaciens]SHJ65797.1 hypothetical protein SAMN02745181_2283 [Rubritalea squalenifaciens DSM 18772]